MHPPQPPTTERQQTHHYVTITIIIILYFASNTAWIAADLMSFPVFVIVITFYSSRKIHFAVVLLVVLVSRSHSLQFCVRMERVAQYYAHNTFPLCYSASPGPASQPAGKQLSSESTSTSAAAAGDA